MSEHLMTTYAPASLAFERGEGAWLWDENGRRYLDAVAGIAVCSLGHAHPALARVIADQAGRLIHTANLVRIPWQEHLADRLAGITGMERIFVANSGAEAVECAIKINRMLGHARGVELPSIIVMEGSFHGRTLATLSASGSRKVQAGFEPLVHGFVRVPYGDIDAFGDFKKKPREGFDIPDQHRVRFDWLERVLVIDEVFGQVELVIRPRCQLALMHDHFRRDADHALSPMEIGIR